MAVLLENQAKQLVSEASGAGTDSNSEEWAGVALPLVRRIFAEIAAKDFVSVQPMNLPSGLVFYLDFKYGTAQNQITSAGGNDFLTGQGRTSQADSVFGITDAASGTAATEGLYGPGRFGYSINEHVSTADDIGTGDTDVRTGSIDLTSSTKAFKAATVMSTAEFLAFTNYNSEFSASQAGKAHIVVSVPSASLVNSAITSHGNYDQNAVRSFNLSGSLFDHNVHPEFTTCRICSSNICSATD
jgi:hypothetical protein